MYRSTGAGKDPTPPALLAMLVMLQSHPGTSDAEAVDLTVMDLRWQMVLDRLGAEEAAFGQGTLVDFRERLEPRNLDLPLPRMPPPSFRGFGSSHGGDASIFEATGLRWPPVERTG